MNSKENLRNLIIESAANVSYTYSAHWHIVNRLKCHQFLIKLAQIFLTAVTTMGLITIISTGSDCLNWLSAVCSAVSLSLNLYVLNFNLPDNIKAHTDAANELWKVRESYRALLVDFDDISPEDIRERRDQLTEFISLINKKYPGTDNKSFKQAQSDMSKYTYSKGEAAKLLHIDNK